MIFSKEIMPDERLTRDGIELVAIDERQLDEHTRDKKEHKREKNAKER